MISGNEVGLRALEKEDLEQLRIWRNNTELRKYFRETDEISKLNQEKWFDSISEKNSLNKMFAIVKLDTDELMGTCGLCYIDWINKSADFSIYLGYDNIYIDDKYAVEAAKLMIDHAFRILNLHRLWTEIYSIDFKKKDLFKELKFKKDGEFRETYWYDNKWHNSLFYSLLSTDDYS